MRTLFVLVWNTLPQNMFYHCVVYAVVSHKLGLSGASGQELQ